MPPDRSSGSGGKSLRLRFKGDKPEKKKKKSSSHASGDADTRKRSKSRRKGPDEESDVEDVGGNEQAWVPVERLTDWAGPSFLFQHIEGTSDPQHVCLALEPTRNRVEAHAVAAAPSLALTDEQRIKADLVLDLDGAEIVDLPSTGASDSALVQPADVMQVWVATRVLDTPSSAPRITLRSAEARFLTAERDGSVSAFTEARGPLEEWTVVEGDGDGVFALQSGRPAQATAGEAAFLGIDLAEKGTGRKVVRSDFARDGQLPSRARWHIRVQWKHRHEARKRERGVAPLRDRDPAFRHLRGPDAT